MFKRNKTIIHLESIVQSNEKSDPCEKPYTDFICVGNQIRFRICTIENYVNEKNITKYIPLKTVRLINNDHYRNIYAADYKEYMKVYKNSFNNFIEEEIKPLIKMLKENSKDTFYVYAMKKYEQTLLIVVNTIRESIENNGYVVEGIGKKAILLLRSFIDEINNRDNYLKEIKNQENIKKNSEKKPNLKEAEQIPTTKK